MARKRKKVRRLSDITTHRELREARTRLDMKLWYAEQRFTDNLSATFSVENLIAMVAPPGSLADTIIGGAGKLIAIAKGVMSATGYFGGKR